MKEQKGKRNHNNTKICVEEATKDLSNTLLISYFSQVESLSDDSFELKEKLPDSIIIGSTTYASFCSNGAYKDTLMVLGLESGIDCRANILEEVDKYPLKYINVVEETARDFCSNGDTICFEVTTALMNCEEFVLSTLNSILEKKNIPVFVGSAGD